MHPIIAIFITDAQVDAATSSDGGNVFACEFENSESGVDALLAWLRDAMPGESEPSWVATVPEGDGGAVYSWLYEAVPELFLQNPDALKQFASKVGLPWRAAKTLLAYQEAKVW